MTIDSAGRLIIFGVAQSRFLQDVILNLQTRVSQNDARAALNGLASSERTDHLPNGNLQEQWEPASVRAAPTSAYLRRYHSCA
jgi:hypothetical protein